MMMTNHELEMVFMKGDYLAFYASLCITSSFLCSGIRQVTGYFQAWLMRLWRDLSRLALQWVATG
ncbi:MAG: hypothetical protein AAF551_08480, partial [Bacteroidota bacterium]